MADADAENNYTVLMLVLLVEKQSVETLKLLVNFEMMEEIGFLMDKDKSFNATGGK